GKVMATLPKEMDKDKVTLEQAVELLDAKSGKSGKGAKSKTTKTAKPKATKSKSGTSTRKKSA
ncbi:MAG: hypothetical protein HOH04_13965, partial [Rhodospirillaceae bacterium]|nr:hypothetical protein [Rhodospirillaceae bacterium]